MSCGVKVCIVLLVLEVFVFVSYFFVLTSFSVVAVAAVAAVAAAAATTTATVVNIVMTLIRILKR